MHARCVSRATIVCSVLAAAALVLPSHGGTFRVANDGVDTPTCGAPATPCLSINRAIFNAAPGDKILVNPGRYSPAREGAPAGCATSCMVFVDKKLTIESPEGGEVTVLDAESAVDNVVEIAADGVTFGRRHRGFMLTSGNDSGLLIGPGVSGVDVGDNLSSSNDNHGFEIHGMNHLLEYNEAIDNDVDGFYINAPNSELNYNRSIENDDDGYEIRGDGQEFRQNLASDSVDRGFVLFNGSDHSYRENVASANGSGGFLVRTTSGDDHEFIRNVFTNNDGRGMNLAGGAGHLVELNAIVGNKTAGIATSIDDLTITRNNIFGNDDGANCGIENNSGVPIAAPDNFWGVAAGPGADPADDVCGAAIATAPDASARFSQPFGFLPLP